MTQAVPADEDMPKVCRRMRVVSPVEGRCHEDPRAHVQCRGVVRVNPLQPERVPRPERGCGRLVWTDGPKSDGQRGEKLDERIRDTCVKRVEGARVDALVVDPVRPAAHSVFARMDEVLQSVLDDRHENALDGNNGAVRRHFSWQRFDATQEEKRRGGKPQPGNHEQSATTEDERVDRRYAYEHVQHTPITFLTFLSQKEKFSPHTLRRARAA